MAAGKICMEIIEENQVNLKLACLLQIDYDISTSLLKALSISIMDINLMPANKHARVVAPALEFMYLITPRPILFTL